MIAVKQSAAPWLQWRHCDLTRDEKIYIWRWPAIYSLIAGALMSVKINVMGELFLGEVMLLAVIPVLFFDRFFLRAGDLATFEWIYRPAKILFFSLMITCIGYMLSDLYRNNDPKDYLRGWAKLFFLGSNLMALCLLISAQRWNIVLFVFGIGAGGIIYSLSMGTPLHYWKLGYAGNVTLILVVLLSLINSRKVQAACFVSVGILHILWDFRSLGALCVCCGVVALLNLSSRRDRSIQVFFGATIILLVVLISYYASQGSFAQRRQASNSIRLSNAMIGLNVVFESPWIGYGAWGRDARIAKQYADLQFRMDKSTDNPIYDYDIIKSATIPSHSQALMSIIEGGLLGGAFFIIYFFGMMRAIAAVISLDAMRFPKPFVLYFIFMGLWNLLMSPFSGGHRFMIPITCVSIIIVFYYREEKRSVFKSENPMLAKV